MGFGGRLLTALAILAAHAATGRGDELQTLKSVPRALPSSRATAKPATQPGAASVSAPAAETPRLAPPDELPGTWVSDGASTAPATGGPQPINQTPLPMGGYPPGYPTALPASYYSPPPGANPYGPGPNANPGLYGGDTFDTGQHIPGPEAGPNGPGPYDEGCPCGQEGCSCGGGHGGCLANFFGGPCFGLWNQVHTGQKYWVRGEYLSFWAKGNPVPALVTTSFPGTPQTQAGVLGAPSTTVLFGDAKLDGTQRNGAKISFGYWFGEGQFNGIEGHYFALVQGGTTYDNTQSFTANPTTAQILAHPFYNVDPGLAMPRQDASILAYPNFNLLGTTVVLDGSVNVKTTANVQSAGALFRHMLWTDFEAGYKVDVLGGYRFFKVDDSVLINDSTTTMGGFLARTTFTASDYFIANNTFNGGEVGFAWQQYWGRLSLDTLAKSAFGAVHESVRISGESTVTTLGQTAKSVGGLLAQPSNIGQYGQTRFAALPEVALTLRYDLTCHWRISAGYNFMYLTAVQHSGSAIDTTINPTQIGGTLVGPVRPTFAFADTGFFVQGVTSGLEYRW